MKHSILAAAMLSALALTACDRPTVVTAVPAVVPVPVPGPAGPTGATGAQGDTGKSGQGTTVVVVTPPASAPAN